MSKKPSPTIKLAVGAACCAVLGLLYGNSVAIALESRAPSRSVGTKARGLAARVRGIARAPGRGNL